MILDTVDRLLELVLDNTPSAPVDIVVAYVETRRVAGRARTFKPHPEITTVSDTTPTVILDSPPDDDSTRTLTSIEIHNPNTTAVELTIFFVDDGDETIFKRVRIGAEDNFEYMRHDGTRVLDSKANLLVTGLTPTGIGNSPDTGPPALNMMYSW